MKKKLRLKAMALSSVFALNTAMPTVQLFADEINFDSEINDYNRSSTNELVEGNSSSNSDGYKIYTVAEDAISPVVSTFSEGAENNPTIWLKNGQKVTLSSEIERLIKSALNKTLEGIGQGVTTEEVTTPSLISIEEEVSPKTADENLSTTESSIEDENNLENVTKVEETNKEEQEEISTQEDIKENDQLKVSSEEENAESVQKDTTSDTENKTENTYVNFKDEKLKNAVNEALEAIGAPSSSPNKITPSAMASLKTLDISSKEITDLTGLETAINLVELNLSNNNIETKSLPNIAKLTKLEKLNLSNNKITEFKNFTGDSTPSLKEIDLSRNLTLTTIKDINLPKLEKIDLKYNTGITTISNVNLASISEINLQVSTKIETFERVNLNNVQLLSIYSNVITTFKAVNLEKAKFIEFPSNPRFKEFSYINAPNAIKFVSDDGTINFTNSSSENAVFNYIDLSSYVSAVNINLSDTAAVNSFKINNLNIPKAKSLSVNRSQNQINTGPINRVENINADSATSISFGQIFHFNNNQTTNRDFMMKNLSLNSLTIFGTDFWGTNRMANMENVSLASFTGQLQVVGYVDKPTKVKNLYAPLATSFKVITGPYLTATDLENVNLAKATEANAFSFDNVYLAADNVSISNGGTGANEFNSDKNKTLKISNLITPRNVTIRYDKTKNAKIEDIKEISNISNLTSLTFNSSSLSDISFLEEIKSRTLTSIDLTDAKISDIGPLKTLAERNPSLNSVALTGQTIDLTLPFEEIPLNELITDSKGLLSNTDGSTKMTYSTTSESLSIDQSKGVVKVNGNGVIRFTANVTIGNIQTTYSGTININTNSDAKHLNFKILDSNDNSEIKNLSINESEIRSTEDKFKVLSNFKLFSTTVSTLDYKISKITIDGKDFAELSSTYITAPKSGENKIYEVAFLISKVGSTDVVYTKKIYISLTNSKPVISSNGKALRYIYGDKYLNLKDYVTIRDFEDSEESLINNLKISIKKFDGTIMTPEAYFSSVKFGVKENVTVVYNVTDSNGNTADEYTASLSVNDVYIEGISDMVKAAANYALGRSDLEGELTQDDILSVKTIDISLYGAGGIYDPGVGANHYVYGGRKNHADQFIIGNSFNILQNGTTKELDRKAVDALEGLQYFTNIESLILDDFNVAPLENMYLPKLKKLYLYNATGLENFVFSIENMPSLITLEAPFSDISEASLLTINESAFRNTLRNLNIVDSKNITKLTGLKLDKLTELACGASGYFKDAAKLINFDSNILPSLVNLYMGLKDTENFNNNVLSINSSSNLKFRTITGYNPENFRYNITGGINENNSIINFNNNDIKLEGSNLGMMSELEEFVGNKLILSENTLPLNLKALKKFSDNNIPNVTNITFTNCNNLTTISNNNFSSLRTLSIRNAESLGKIEGNKFSVLRSINMQQTSIKEITKNDFSELESLIINGNSSLKKFDENIFARKDGVKLSFLDYTGELKIDKENVYDKIKTKIIGLNFRSTPKEKVDFEGIDPKVLLDLGIPKGLKSLDEVETFKQKKLPSLETLHLGEEFEELIGYELPSLVTIYMINPAELGDREENHKGVKIEDNNLGRLTSLRNGKLVSFSNNKLNETVSTFTFNNLKIGTISSLFWNNLTTFSTENSDIDLMTNIEMDKATYSCNPKSINRISNIKFGANTTFNLSNKGLKEFNDVNLPLVTQINLSRNQLSKIKGLKAGDGLSSTTTDNLNINLSNNRIIDTVSLKSDLTSSMPSNVKWKIISINAQTAEATGIIKDGKVTFKDLNFEVINNGNVVTVNSSEELNYSANGTSIFLDGGKLESDNSSVGSRNTGTSTTKTLGSIIWENATDGTTKTISLLGDIPAIKSSSVTGSNANLNLHNPGTTIVPTTVRVNLIDSASVIPVIGVTKSDITLTKSEYKALQANKLDEIKKKIEENITVKENEEDVKSNYTFEYVDALPTDLSSNKIYIVGLNKLNLPTSDDFTATYVANLTCLVTKNGTDNTTESLTVRIRNEAPRVSYPGNLTVSEESREYTSGYATKDAYEFLTEGVLFTDYEDDKKENATTLKPKKVEVVRINSEGIEESFVYTKTENSQIRSSEGNNTSTNKTVDQLISELFKVTGEYTYKVKYTVVDSEGNETVDSGRTISYIPYTKPTLVLPESFTKVTDTRATVTPEKYKTTIYTKDIQNYLNTTNLNGVRLSNVNTNYSIIKEVETTSGKETYVPGDTIKITYKLMDLRKVDSSTNTQEVLQSIELAATIASNEVDIKFDENIWKLNSTTQKYERSIELLEKVNLSEGVSFVYKADKNVAAEGTLIVNQVDTSNLKTGEYLTVNYSFQDQDGNIFGTNNEYTAKIYCAGARVVYSLKKSEKSEDAFIDIEDSKSNYLNDILSKVNLVKTSSPAGLKNEVITGADLAKYLKVYITVGDKETLLTGKTDEELRKFIQALSVGKYTFRFEINEDSLIKSELGEGFFDYRLNVRTLSTVINISNFNMPDKHLATAVKETLGLPAEHVLKKTDLSKLTKLTIPNSLVSDLTGLQYATNLESLIIRGTGSEEDPKLTNKSNINLSNLSKLTNLDLRSNGITDVSAIKGLNNLTNLSTLNLAGNSISSSDFSFTGNLQQLKTLDLSNNKLTEVNNLKSTSITNLNLSYNFISNISDNLSLPKVTTINLRSNSLTAISEALMNKISNFSALKILDLSSNKLTGSFSGLSNPTLQNLSLNTNKIESLENIKLPKLTTLNVYENKLQNLNNVRLDALQNLDLRYNELQSINGLYSPNLISVNLNYNKLRSLLTSSGEFIFKDSPRIKTLYLKENNINTLIKNNKLILSDLSDLTEVDLTNNSKITNLSNYSSERLETLTLNGTNIEHIENVNLPSVTSLTGLSIVKSIKNSNLPGISINSPVLESVKNTTVYDLGIAPKEIENVTLLIKYNANNFKNINRTSLQKINGFELTNLTTKLAINSNSSLTEAESINIPLATSLELVGNNKLTALDNVYAPKVTTLTINESSLRELTNSNFEALTSINTDTANTFNALTNIKNVNLKSLTSIGNTKFSNANTIERLILDSLEEFDLSQGKSKIQSLKNIYLPKARLVNLSGRLNTNVDISSININTGSTSTVNRNSILKPATTEESRTVVLKLSNNNLTSTNLLSSFKVHNLSELDLSNNSLTNIYEEDQLIKFISSLTGDTNLTVNLDSNQIHDVTALNQYALKNQKIKIKVTNQIIKGINLSASKEDTLNQGAYTLDVNLNDVLSIISGLSSEDYTLGLVKDSESDGELSDKLTFDNLKEKDIVKVMLKATPKEGKNLAEFSAIIQFTVRTGQSSWLEFKNSSKDSNITVSKSELSKYISDTVKGGYKNIVKVLPENASEQKVNIFIKETDSGKSKYHFFNNSEGLLSQIVSEVTESKTIQSDVDNSNITTEVTTKKVDKVFEDKVISEITTSYNTGTAGRYKVKTTEIITYSSIKDNDGVISITKDSSGSTVITRNNEEFKNETIPSKSVILTKGNNSEVNSEIDNIINLISEAKVATSLQFEIETGKYKTINLNYTLGDIEEAISQNISATNYAPTITNSLTEISMRINETYEDGYLATKQEELDKLLDETITATDREDGDITTIASQKGAFGIYLPKVLIDKLNIGNNSIEYSVTDKDGNTTTVTRNIKLTQNKAPVINTSDLTLKYANKDSFDAQRGVTVTDDVDTELTATITNPSVLNQIKNYSRKNTLTTFEIEYRAEDSEGAFSTVTRKVNISNYDPTLTVSSSPLVISSTSTSVNLLSGVSATDIEDVASNLLTFKVFLTTKDKVEHDVTSLASGFTGTLSDETELKPGSYTLRYEVTDTDGNTTTKSGRQFIVRDPNIKAAISAQDISKTNRAVSQLSSGNATAHSEGIDIYYGENDSESTVGLNVEPENSSRIREVDLNSEATYTVDYNTENYLKDSTGSDVTYYLDEDGNVKELENSKFTRTITISNYEPKATVSSSKIKLTIKNEITQQELLDQIIKASGLKVIDKEDGDITSRSVIYDLAGLDLNTPQAGTYYITILTIDNDSNSVYTNVAVVVNGGSSNSNTNNPDSNNQGNNNTIGGNGSSTGGGGGSSTINPIPNPTITQKTEETEDNKTEKEETSKTDTTEKTNTSTTNKNQLTLSSIKLPTMSSKENITNQNFTDVTQPHWAYESIQKLSKLGVVTGVGGNLYNPSKDITRGDVTVMLVKLLGLELEEITNFKDVPQDKYYHNYIATLSKYNIINGYENGDFKPENSILRQDMMVMIAQLLRQLGINEVVNQKELTEFTDYSSISEYAKESVKMLVRAGIVNGRNTGEIGPKDTISRAEVAVILSRVYALIEKNVK